MPEELGNLLIRVTSVGFDEVIESLHELEEAVGRVSSNNSFSEIKYVLDGIKNNLDEVSEGLKDATDGFRSFGNGAHESGQHVNAQSSVLERNQRLLTTLAKAYASFWVMFNAPRSFFNTLDGIARLNRQLTSLSVNAMMSRESLVALGAATSVFGGSSQDVGDFASRAGLAMQGMRMGQGGGAFEQAAAMYGLNIFGTGLGGLAKPDEMMRNVVVALGNLPNMEDKLGLKSMLGISDALFQVMLKGTAAWDSYLKKQEEYKKRLEGTREATEKWNEATAELNVEWEILKSQIFVQLEPYVRNLIDFVKEMTRLMQDHPGILASVITAVKTIATIVAAWKFGQAVVESAKLLGNLRNIGNLFRNGSLGSGSGDTESRASSSGGGGGGWLGIGAALGNLIANGVTAGKQWQSANVLNMIYDLMKGWFALWAQVNTTIAYSKDPHAKQVYKSIFDNMPAIADKEAWTKQFTAADRRRRVFETNLIRMSQRRDEINSVKSKRGTGGVATFNISMNIGTVESSAENYSGLVKELVDKAKDVVSQRMENADWFDSKNGVIVV